ncbi:MAG: hypothetical protein Q8O55_11750 [Dehalococcoidales bacterium]|nr:hypothetical protein [Dehalococcoidales bacterium]
MMRVVLASEWPQLQGLLTDVVEEEPGAVVIGQAENAIKVLDLAENLRPDVAIIDSELPYSVGMDGLTLSRMSGLDIAQSISQRMPGTRVVLVNNLDVQLIPKGPSSRDRQVFFSRKGIAGNTIFRLNDLNHDGAIAATPIFANIEVKTRLAAAQKDDQAPRNALSAGTVSIGGGLYLIGTLWLAPYGVLLVLAGLALYGYGLLKKFTARFWRSGKIQTEH